MKKTARRFAAPSSTAQSRLTASSAGMQMPEKAAGVADSQTERSILKERPVVPPPDGPAAQRVHKAGPNRFGQWEQIEQAQPQQAGQQKRQCLPALPPAQASDLWPFHRLHLLAYTVAQGT